MKGLKKKGFYRNIGLAWHPVFDLEQFSSRSSVDVLKSLQNIGVGILIPDRVI